MSCGIGPARYLSWDQERRLSMFSKVGRFSRWLFGKYVGFGFIAAYVNKRVLNYINTYTNLTLKEV